MTIMIMIIINVIKTYNNNYVVVELQFEMYILYWIIKLEIMAITEMYFITIISQNINNYT